MKRTLTFISLLWLLCTTAMAVSGTCGATASDDLHWELVKNNSGYTLLISGTGKMHDYSEEFSAPWGGYMSDITSIVLGDGITQIGARAFKGAAITSVGFPGTLRVIRESAFEGTQLRELYLASTGLSRMEHKAFAGCKQLGRLHLPSDALVYRAGSSLFQGDVFDGCTALSDVYITGTPTIHMGTISSPFASLSLADVTLHLPENLSEEEQLYYATASVWREFKNMRTLNGVACGCCGHYTHSDTNLRWYLTKNSDGESLTLTLHGSLEMADYDDADSTPWKNYKTAITRVVLPEGLTAIGDYAFSGLQSLTSIALPGSLTKIGNYAFAGSGLTAFTLPASLSDWGYNIFDSCTALTEVTVGTATPLDVSSYYYQMFEGFAAKNATLTIPSAFGKETVCAYATADVWKTFRNMAALKGHGHGNCGADGDNLRWYHMGDTLHLFGSGAMADFESEGAPWYANRYDVEGIAFPDGLTAIGSYAFCGADLSHVTVPSSVTVIGEGAFQECVNMEDITLPGTVTTIGAMAFEACRSLQAFTLPASLTTWGIGLFQDCTGLTTITASTATPLDVATCDMFLALNTSDITLLFAEGLSEETKYLYASALGWKEFKNMKDLSVTAQGSCGTGGSDLRWYVTEGGTTLEIFGSGRMADYPHEYITKVTPWQAYQKDIVCLKLEEGIESIGSYAFEEMSITSVSLPSTLTAIGEDAFYLCSKLNAIDLSETKVTTIGSYAFNSCNALTSVSLPACLEQLGNLVFTNMPGGTITLRSLPQSASDIAPNAAVVVDLTDSQKPFATSALTNYPSSISEVSYHRSLANDGKWGTIVLPFTPSAESIEGIEFFELTSTATDGGALTFTQVDEAVGGVPYLFRNATADADFTLGATDAALTVDVTPQKGDSDEWTLTGTFQSLVITDADELDGTYYLSSNKVMNATQSLTIQPFRAYFQGPSYAATFGAKGLKSIVIRTADGITRLNPETLEEQPTVCYDLSGRAVAEPNRGIYIVNGKKQLVK